MEEYSTSEWVIEEKTYALDLRKKILLYVEDGVRFSPGLQSDYEYIKFSRENFSDALLGSIPYLLSAITEEYTSTEEYITTKIDKYEAQRILIYIGEKYKLSIERTEVEQNLIFRETLIRGVMDDLDYDFNNLVFLIEHANSIGYKLALISKSLFGKYSRQCKEIIEQTRLSIASGSNYSFG